MEKHFPLHHLLTRHNIQGLKKFKDVEAINFLKFQGDLLENKLRKIDNKDTNNNNACEKVLTEFKTTSENIARSLNYNLSRR